MARKTITGLYERNGIWHVDKVVRGQRLQESTGTSNREEAEQYLIHRLEKLRQEKVYGIRRVRSWREAATRYLMEYKDMPSIGLAAIYLEQLDPYIGDLPLTHVDDESLSPYIKDKLKPSRASTGKVKPGVTPRTVNIALEKVIRILNLCARKWRDEEKRPWLDTVPMINKLDEKRSRRPLPAFVGRAIAAVLGTAGPPAPNGALQGQLRLSGARSGQAEVGLGDPGTGVGYQRVPDSFGLWR